MFSKSFLVVPFFAFLLPTTSMASSEGATQSFPPPHAFSTPLIALVELTATLEPVRGYGWKRARKKMLA
jgi:hypothetical protein